MARRKVTFVYDPAERYGPNEAPLSVPEEFVRDMRGVDPSSVTVEDLPDPPVVQRFLVERTATPHQGPYADYQVTEVTDA